MSKNKYLILAIVLTAAAIAVFLAAFGFPEAVSVSMIVVAIGLLFASNLMYRKFKRS